MSTRSSRAVTPRTKIVFLANPNNPTGTYLPFDEVKRLHAGLPPHVLLVLDAAYAEYVRRNDYEAGIELVATADNVVMTRTFSKIYGLAALRLGWMVRPGRMWSTRSTASAARSTSTAPRWRPASRRSTTPPCRKRARAQRRVARLADAGDRRPWARGDAERGNFLLVHFPGHRAQRRRRCLPTRAGLILRRVAAYDLPDALRLTVGRRKPTGWW